MVNFWKALPKPFFALAPMEDVTDAAFRRLIATHGKPDVMFTEFVSADGLLLADEDGQRKLRAKLIFSDSERPIVAQLFTSEPQHMERATKIVAELGFDGVDINMGCPDRAVEKSSCGAALIKNPSLARELIAAARRGFSCASQTCTRAEQVPVSVKTRIGYNKDELDAWLPHLLAEKPVAITVHARTRKEMSLVPAHWEAVARAVELRDKHSSPTLIIGNGDVRDMEDARKKAAATGCDGVMLGRAIFGNPWLFSHPEKSSGQSRGIGITPEKKVRALIEHVRLFDQLSSGVTNYAALKKHFKAYISGWRGAKELRQQLMETTCSGEAIKILSEVH